MICTMHILCISTLQMHMYVSVCIVCICMYLYVSLLIHVGTYIQIHKDTYKHTQMHSTHTGYTDCIVCDKALMHMSSIIVLLFFFLFRVGRGWLWHFCRTLNPKP